MISQKNISTALSAARHEPDRPTNCCWRRMQTDIGQALWTRRAKAIFTVLSVGTDCGTRIAGIERELNRRNGYHNHPRWIRTLVIQVFPEHRLRWIKTTVDDIHEQAFVRACRLCQ